MRTMLISLILFCSLTQFAIADDQPTAPTGRKFVEGCGTNYVCYAPEICTNPNPPPGKTLKDLGVHLVEKETHITNDCPAIIRYHLYTSSWIYGTIESYQPIATVKSIEFLHSDALKTDERTKFSCEHNTGKTTVQWLTSEVNGHEINIPTKKHLESKDNPTTLKCTFTAKTKRNTNIFNIRNHDYLSFKINDDSTVVTKKAPDVDYRCNPLNLIYYKAYNETKTFKKIAFKPGEYFCEGENFKMEFRKDESTDKYEIAEKVECHENKFKINGAPYLPDEKFDVRCVADTKFFCKYKMKQTSHTPVEGPDPREPVTKESVMKCPPGKPNLMIEGELTPILQPKFQCLNHGNEQLWTVATSAKKYLIKENELEIYCTDEVKCQDIKMIPESSVKDGYLGESDFLPKCFQGGTLYLEESGKKTENFTTKCDGKSGEFKYVIEGDEFVIGEGTKFECKYPDVVNTLKNEQNEKTIVTGSLAAGGVALVLAVAITGIGCFICARRAKEDRQKIQMMNNAGWLAYGANEDEKMKNNPNQPKKKKATLASGLSESLWNDMLFSFNSKGKKQKDTNDFTQSMLLDRKIKDNSANVAAGRSMDKPQKNDVNCTWAPSQHMFAYLAIPREDLVKEMKAPIPDPKKSKNKSQKAQ